MTLDTVSQSFEKIVLDLISYFFPKHIIMTGLGTEVCANVAMGEGT